MKILVLGGTKYFGRRLVERLLDEEHEVTVATRGQSPLGFSDKVHHVVVNRGDAHQMERAFQHSNFDVVFDQIGYVPNDVAISTEALSGRVKRYVFTSSMAVYDHKDGNIREEQFNPFNYEVSMSDTNLPYDEGKRQCEAFLFQNAPFEVVSARVSMVISADDQTGRFQWHVDRVQNQIPIGVHSVEYPITYVTAWDVAEFLCHMGTKSDLTGPFNVGNQGAYSVQELCKEMGKILQSNPVFEVHEGQGDVLSPYLMVPRNLVLSMDKAAEAGFRFPDLAPYLPDMVERAARNS